MITKDDRKAYWNSQIAFDCPNKGGRHTIDACFTMCEASSYFYRDGVVVMYCTYDDQERELQSGTPTRDK